MINKYNTASAATNDCITITVRHIGTTRTWWNIGTRAGTQTCMLAVPVMPPVVSLSISHVLHLSNPNPDLDPDTCFIYESEFANLVNVLRPPTSMFRTYNSVASTLSRHSLARAEVSKSKNKKWISNVNDYKNYFMDDNGNIFMNLASIQYFNLCLDCTYEQPCLLMFSSVTMEIRIRWIRVLHLYTVLESGLPMNCLLYTSDAADE